MNNKNYIFLLLISSIVSSCNISEKKPKPNIILILADDLGYNDLSCYRNTNLGQSEKPPTCQTPNLDKLATEGMRFTDFYCGAAVCSPSRAALLTGRNATRIGIYNWLPGNSPMHLRDSEITIAEILKPAGYQTGHFGKWHLTSEGMDQSLPNDQGFDYEFFTYNNAIPSHHNPVNFIRNGAEVGELKGYACQLVVDEALSWLQANKDDPSPFYINIWFNEPHVKLAAPEKFTSRHNYREKYYGAIENLDDATGRLLQYLKENHLDENTIVIFTSDNGSQDRGSNDPLRSEKCFNYEGGVRSPFIVKWPGKIQAGMTNNTIGSFTDVLPSLTSMVGIGAPEDRILDGHDLSGVFTGKTSSIVRENPIFFYRYFHDPATMLREGDLILLGYSNPPPPYQKHYSATERANLKPDSDKTKWSMWSFQPIHMDYIKSQEIKYFELYNIKDDPGQEKDLMEEFPDKVETMKKKMIALKKEMVCEGGDWYNE